MGPKLRNSSKIKEINTQSFVPTISPKSPLSISKKFMKKKTLKANKSIPSSFEKSKQISPSPKKYTLVKKLKNKVLPPSDRESIERDSKLSISRLSDDLYRVCIPNLPSNIEFDINILNGKMKSSSLEASFYKTPNIPDLFILDTQYPIFDRDGIMKASLITKRKYSRTSLSNLKNPILTLATEISQNNLQLYEETINKQISESNLTIKVPDIIQKLNNIDTPMQSTFLKPVKASQEIFIQGETSKDKTPLSPPETSILELINGDSSLEEGSSSTNLTNSNSQNHPSNDSSSSSSSSNPTSILQSLLMLQSLASQAQQSTDQ